ncbi:hypothetical protein [Zeaxanthinibacter enoshimensis]|uniref:DUF481 domain-containing protein n=1 Tax=Zeaxanthinibacter enoshimensis TaxID=392009 RepID=A0A4R6TK04_9FLAO|nr:hypothetical protein [Zeaxanthinibacter enoshimensis]TDQ31196.1 hypothetical protein CLV82_1901 [Zeaxanthinibacter enoshimensis]
MKNTLHILLFLFLGIAIGKAQKEGGKFLDDFRGTASVTHNGISLVPSFSLGDPALLFDLKSTKGRLSFEPDMRFALEGKPWSFLFWFRYKAIEKDRFSFRIGAHPALNFRTVSVLRDGQSEDILESRRYLALELVPNYKISEQVSFGVYYLRGQGFDAGIKTTNFLVLNTTLTYISITDDLYLNISPQVYYLTTDALKGFYTVAFLTLGKRDFPFSLSAILNKAIDTEIAPEESFTWNVSLNYSFGGTGRKITGNQNQ